MWRLKQFYGLTVKFKFKFRQKQKLNQNKPKKGTKKFTSFEKKFLFLLIMWLKQLYHLTIKCELKF